MAGQLGGESVGDHHIGPVRQLDVYFLEECHVALLRRTVLRLPLLECECHAEQVMQLVVVELVRAYVPQNQLLLVIVPEVDGGGLLTVHVAAVQVEVVDVHLADEHPQTVRPVHQEEQVGLLASGVHVVLLPQVLLQPEVVLGLQLPECLAHVEVLDGVVVVLDDVVGGA